MENKGESDHVLILVNVEILEIREIPPGKVRDKKGGVQFSNVKDPQACVYPDVCLGIAHVSGKAPLPGQGVWQIHNVSAPFAPRNL